MKPTISDTQRAVLELVKKFKGQTLHYIVAYYVKDERVTTKIHPSTVRSLIKHGLIKRIDFLCYTITPLGLSAIGKDK